MADQRYLDALAESYKNASSWDTRKQVLSIMTDLASYAVISSFIPGLTKYRYTAANLHRLQFGRGVPVLVQTSARIRIDSKQLDHFLSFITSPHLVQDLPFGQKHLTLSSGKVLEVPNVIRTMIPRRIVQQYSRYCEETNFHPLSDSTMFRILSECSASVRKSLQGLDYFAADGSRAFDELLSLVPKLVEYGATDREWEVKTTENLKTSRLYLKGDYKVHLDNADKVADHCLVFSLSDSSDADFKKECNHKHDAVCEQCLALEETLKDIEGCFKDFEFPSVD
ncbi:uncharacterized protein LOC116309034, partial [Actinia tenebrosa]|uniref:Uncharacterized protein LOC116309034 n=1 Tax=Actinia tenebrosa TaxID=6105 RepID=A0A6P8JGP7_ACTTE